MRATRHGNKWKVTYRCKGIKNPISEYFETKEQAELRIAQVNLEKKMGTFQPPARFVDPDRNHALARETMTVEQLMGEYVNLYGLSHWSESTLSCNQHRINHYILPYIGDIPIKELTTHRLEEFYQLLLSEPAIKLKGREEETRTISPSVIQKVHAIIRSALNQAIRWDYLRGTNPAFAVEPPRYKREHRAAWDDQEARYALDVCSDPILHLAMSLALGCSMRIGEILGLTWDCIHIEDELVRAGGAYLSVEKELQRCNKDNLERLRAQGRDEVFFTFPTLKQEEECTTVLVLKTPKTASSTRDIYIPGTIVAELQRTRAYQESMKKDLGPEYYDFNLVVAQDNGRPVEKGLITERLRALIRTYNLRPVVFHSLRHSSTSLKLKLSGGDIKAVQGDTGHAQANMVTDVYSHIWNEDRKRLAEKVEAQFFAGERVAGAEKAEEQKTVDDSTAQLMELIQKSPELAESLLKMSKILGGGNK